MRRLLLSFFGFFGALMVSGSGASAAQTGKSFELREGDRVVFLGDTFIEREQYHGWIELMLTTRFADRNVTFRNLGWSADTPAGDSRFGLSLLQAGKEPSDEGWQHLVKQLEDARPTVVFAGYGMASSFDGEAGLPKFKADYNRLLDTLEKISPGTRLALLGPVMHEKPGPPWPDPAAHRRSVELYDAAVQQIADQRGARFISLLKLGRHETHTGNGIHLTSAGYKACAAWLENEFFSHTGSWTLASARQGDPGPVDILRQAIIRKNEWFFYRSRPANMAYIFGFRKREQGRNAVEIPKFDSFIAAEEQRIAALRLLKPVEVPEVKTHVGNLTARHTEQPHPRFEVEEGFEVSLYAEDPLLHKPIQMNFDPQGRLWIASSEVYPQIEPGQEATDKIIVLEDTNGDGKAEKATVFAGGLLIPTGVAPGDGGCYVGQSTDLLHFKDVNGDGKADTKTRVLSGFGTEDTHHNLHTLRWGPDGRLYMNQSIYTRTDTETPYGVVRLKGGGVFRFDPRDERMEIMFLGWVNPWGHQFDAFGQSFVTDGAGSGGINYGLPGASYVTAPVARRILGSVSPGNYPKFAALEIIHSAQFPQAWQGDMITCDFRAHRVVRFKITGQGSGYVTQEMPDLLRSTDASFRPIDVRLGPDGALYIADWSNPIIQHGEVDFRDPRRDKEHGRIWRVTAKGRKPLPKVDLTKLDNRKLLDELLSPNSYRREQAKRVLVERGTGKVAKDLAAWTKKQKDDRALLEALWTYEAFNRPEPALLTKVLAAKDGRVRAAAVRVLGNWVEPAAGLSKEAASQVDRTRAHAWSAEASLAQLAKLVADEHPRVRLEAVRALGRIQSARAAALALRVLDKPMDPFLDYALWLTINELAGPWVAALKSGEWQHEGRETQLQFALKAVEPSQAAEVLGQILGGRVLPRNGRGPWIELIGEAGGPDELRLLFDQLLRGEFVEPASLRAMKALSDAARLRGVKPTGDLARFGPMLKSNNERVRRAAIDLAGSWGVGKFVGLLLQAAGDAEASAGLRSTAFAALRSVGGQGVVANLKKLAGSAVNVEVRREAVTTLAGLNLDAAVPLAIDILNAPATEAEVQSFLRDLLGVKGAGPKLAQALNNAKIPAAAAKAGLRAAREGNRNAELVAALIRAAGLTLSDKELSEAEIRKLATEALVKGDAARGEQIYRRVELACVTCHAIGGAGGKVGPDLTSVGASAPADYLVEAVLYPNRKIKEGYHSVLITTRDEQEFSGIVVSETDAEVVVRNAANQELSLPKKNIATRQNGGSLMPAGLVDGLLPEERLDLFKFLSLLGKPGDYDASKGTTPRVWRVYTVVSRNQHLDVEGVVKGDFKLKDWVPVNALVSGALTREDIEKAMPTTNNVRGLYAGTQLQSAVGGSARFALPVTGHVMDMWINGKPVKVEPGFSVKLQPGLNTVVVGLDAQEIPRQLVLKSPDVSFIAN